VSSGTISGAVNSSAATVKLIGTIPANGIINVCVEPIFKGKCPPTTQKSCRALKVIDAVVDLCKCEASAGSLERTALQVSKGFQSIKIQHLVNSDFYNSDYSAVYVLHEGTKDKIVNLISYNQSGIFEFDDAKMQCNQTYYVSYVVGKLINGKIDFNDTCLKIVPEPQPVVWLCE
jgi:hypothetical protein